MTMRLNSDQRKHIAALSDKVAIAYFAVVGYTAWTKGEYLLAVHTVPMFICLQVAHSSS
jgi:hypothetical protein